MLESMAKPMPEYRPVKMDAAAVQVIDAAAGCVERLGFDKTSIEDIVKTSGVSRATLYRRFGSREGIFIALLLQQAEPIVAASKAAIAAETGLAERIEAGLILAVGNMSRNRWIKALFERSASNVSLNLIRPVFHELVSGVLEETLMYAKASGEFTSTIDFTDILEWLLRDFMMIVSNGPWEKTELQTHVRSFIIPVLKGVPDSTSEDQRLQRVEQRLEEMQRSLEILTTHILSKC